MFLSPKLWPKSNNSDFPVWMKTLSDLMVNNWNYCCVPTCWSLSYNCGHFWWDFSFRCPFLPCLLTETKLLIDHMSFYFSILIFNQLKYLNNVWMDWIFLKTFMVPRGWSLTTLLILWRFLLHLHQIRWLLFLRYHQNCTLSTTLVYDQLPEKLMTFPLASSTLCF